MKPAPFDYARPATVEEACALLAEAGGAAQIIAGGQTLMPLLALRVSQPLLLVDIGRIESLQTISRVEGMTRIGATVRQNQALEDESLARALPVLVTALRHVGHHQTRNRGTIGGSIALGEPAAEMPATAVALGARIDVASVGSTRTIAAEDFFLGPYSTALEPNELLTAVRYPDWPSTSITLFREVAQRAGDFALVGLVGAVCVEHGTISRVGLAWFGMGPTPIRARAAEAALLGSAVASIDPAGIAELAAHETAPFSDAHATAEYRSKVARRIFDRTLRETLDLRLAA